MAKSLAITACGGNEERTTLSNHTCQSRPSMAAWPPQARQSDVWLKPYIQTRKEKTLKKKKNTQKKAQTKKQQQQPINKQLQTNKTLTEALTGCLKLLLSFPIWLNKTWLLLGHYSWCNFSKWTFLWSSSLSKNCMNYMCIHVSSMRRISKSES